MDLSDFDFPFDPALIADRPCEPRDEARLLVTERAGRSCSHRRVRDLPSLLRAGDLLVVNDTKVMPVRFCGRKRPGGGRLDLILVKPLGSSSWEALVKGRVRPGDTIDIGPDATITVEERSPMWTIVSINSRLSTSEVLGRYGQMPLPPYVKRTPAESDRHGYQTIFARADGAIAAPTAGLHFTEALVDALKTGGIRMASITLHVGVATFRPVTAQCVTDHVMLSERCLVTDEACEAIKETRARHGRVVAVGTTVIRALEAASDGSGKVRPYSGETDLFILPGYRFRVVDGIMTNFHLPRTTLVMLVSAFLGRERLLEVYREALQERYRFYSYGDAMLVL